MLLEEDAFVAFSNNLVMFNTKSLRTLPPPSERGASEPARTSLACPLRGSAPRWSAASMNFFTPIISLVS